MKRFSANFNLHTPVQIVLVNIFANSLTMVAFRTQIFCLSSMSYTFFGPCSRRNYINYNKYVQSCVVGMYIVQCTSRRIGTISKKVYFY
jgi:hypothetical protein